MAPYAKPNYLIRAAGPDDAAGIAGLFQKAYGSSSHPCKDPDFIKSTIGSDVWRIAVDDGAVVACTAGTRHEWNQMYERVRAVTDPTYRARGLMRHLMDSVIENMVAQPDCDLILGVTRGRAIMRLVEKETHPPLVVTGHDGGMNVANGRREYHMIGFSVPPGRQPRRVMADCPLPYTSSLMTEPLFSRFDFATFKGPYPSFHIVGPRSPHHISVENWRLNYAYDSRGDSLHITGLSGPETDSKQALDGLASCLQVARETEHTVAYVLYDKADFIRGMYELGFRISAVLPGWYTDGTERYDCLMLTRCTSPVPPAANGLEDMIELFTAGLNDWLVSC